MIAIPKDEWVEFHDMTPEELAAVLVGWAQTVRLSRVPQESPRPEETEAREDRVERRSNMSRQRRY